MAYYNPNPVGQPQFNYQNYLNNTQPIFPQPTGNVYSINNTLEVANVPAGNVSVQLYSNGTKIADAVSSNYSGATGQDGSLHFATIIQVRPSCAMVDNAVNLQVINISGSAIFSNVNLIITKLG